MTGYETYIPGHGVFRAYANSEQNGAAWKAFNKTDATGEGWITDIDEFVADTGYSNTSTATTNTIFGRCSFLAIETPGLIKLEKIRIQPDVNTTGAPDLVKLGMPKDFQIWARKGGTEWTQIAGYTDQIFLYLTGSTEYYDVNVNDYYSEFAIVVTRTHTSSSYSWTSGTSQYTRGSIGEWRLFGTPAPSSLEDGHLTLGKALTLRVFPDTPPGRRHHGRSPWWSTTIPRWIRWSLGVWWWTSRVRGIMGRYMEIQVIHLQREVSTLTDLVLIMF
jgi:hypothetical protein